jgi:predicted transport protein
MSDIKLFKLSVSGPVELTGHSVAVEKSLQTSIEQHLEKYLGVRFLKSEHITGKTHGGRIDTLGIDENCCPVIIEYKRATNQNVINQGLFYLDWLMDHKAEFQLLVLETLGKSIADSIEWSSPRLLCIAGDFTKYDEHAVKQINRNIELIRYRAYGDEFLLLELVNVVTAEQKDPIIVKPPKPNGKQAKSIEDYITRADDKLTDLFDAVKQFTLSLGDDVQEKMLKWYIAFKRIKNFACLEVQPAKNCLLLFVKVDLSAVQLESGFSRDVSNIGHFGTGNLELTLQSVADFEKAKRFIEESYEGN